MRTPEKLTEAIHQRGGKVTPQRLAIYRLLAGNQGHPTAEAIHEALREVMPMVSLTTVYKALNELAAAGEVKRFDVGGVSHFDPNTDPHAEAVCLLCGRIRDVEATVPDEDVRIDGFRVSSVATLFYGYCSDCAARRIET